MREPITLSDTFSGPRYTGPMGAAALFSPLASIVNILVRNSMAPVRIESIDCDVQIEPGRKVAHDRVGPAALRHGRAGAGPQSVRHARSRTRASARRSRSRFRSRDDFPEGPCEAVFCDASNSIRRQFRNDPAMLEPRDLDGLVQIDPGPDRAQADGGLPARPLARARAVGQGAGAAELAGQRPGGLRLEARDPDRRRSGRDIVSVLPVSWVVEGMQTLRFTVAKDAGLSLSLYR